MKLSLKIFFAAFFVLALLSGTTVLGLHWYTEAKLYPELVSAQSQVNQYGRLIMADLKTLEAEPIFKNSEFKKDASAFLQTHIPFDGLKTEASENKQNKIVADLFHRFPNWLTDKMDFNQLTSDPGFAELNPKWIEQLKNYDHWNWTTHPEIQNRIQQARNKSSFDRMSDLVTFPMPNFALLRDWAAVYAIKKLPTKELDLGLKVFRKTAELMNSTGVISGQLQAVAMLKAEHKLMNDFQARNWQLVPLPSIEAYRRLSWAWMHLVRQPFYSDLEAELKNYAKPAYGVCAGTWENMSMLFGLRDLLEPQVSFETNLAQNYIQAQQFQEKLLAQCHLDDFSHYVESSSMAPTSWFSENQILRTASLAAHLDSHSVNLAEHLNWARIPFARKFIGLTLFKTMTPNTLSAYQELSAGKNQN